MLDLILVVLFSVIMVPLVEFTSGAARIVFGLMFLLFSPGYSLIAALFPSRRSLGGIERLALSFGLSIATVPLIGLILNYTPLGIRLYPVLLSVLAFIIIMVGIAWYRRARLEAPERFNLDLRQHVTSVKQTWTGQGKTDRLLNVVLVVAILASISTLGYVIANPKVGERFTEFYILGAEGKADDYPKEIIIGQSAWVTVGITNREQEQTTYEVAVAIQEESLAAFSPVLLEHDENYETVVRFTPEIAGADQKVEFVLFKNGSEEIYLSLHLWIDVVETGTANP